MLIIGLMAISCSEQPTQHPVLWPDITAPDAEKKPHTRIIHGDTVADD